MLAGKKLTDYTNLFSPHEKKNGKMEILLFFFSEKNGNIIINYFKYG